MSSVVVLGLPGNEGLARRLSAGLDLAFGMVRLHRFPDGEARVQVSLPVAGKDTVLAATLHRPDEKLLPLLFASATVRDLGAVSVGLVAPYLAYLRQDRRFETGQGVSARYFAHILARSFDWLVTVDPHLHRTTRLEELYPIPLKVVHTAARVAQWIHARIPHPMIIGPDAESAQWVSALAARVDAPYAVLTKRRMGDRTVDIRLPDLSACLGRQPVLVDDIISSGATMVEAISMIRKAGWPAPACVAVHGVFAPGAYGRLQEAGAGAIATCNTIEHPSNQIDVLDLLGPAVSHCLHPAEPRVATVEGVR